MLLIYPSQIAEARPDRTTCDHSFARKMKGLASVGAFPSGYGRGRMRSRFPRPDSIRAPNASHRAPRFVRERLVHQTEGVDLSALRDLVEGGGFRHGRRADRAELVVHVEARRHRDTDPAAEAGED